MIECPKCGGTSMGIKYIGEREDIPFKYLASRQAKFVSDEPIAGWFIVLQEHLIFTCKTCGFREAYYTKDYNMEAK